MGVDFGDDFVSVTCCLPRGWQRFWGSGLEGLFGGGLNELSWGSF